METTDFQKFRSIYSTNAVQMELKIVYYTVVRQNNTNAAKCCEAECIDKLQKVE